VCRVNGLDQLAVHASRRELAIGVTLDPQIVAEIEIEREGGEPRSGQGVAGALDLDRHGLTDAQPARIVKRAERADHLVRFGPIDPRAHEDLQERVAALDDDVLGIAGRLCSGPLCVASPAIARCHVSR